VEQQQTCGKGLAENAVLPARLGAVTSALADVLEAHVKALDLDDENARAEHEAYTKLVDENRDVAARLRAVAERMAGYRDLPLGVHDERAVTSAEPVAVFEAFVAMKRELLDLLQEQDRRDRQLLVQMREATGRSF
jgi:gamma-glutamyl:cysteine ligase YbdK (ATP-grasp superfamily)